MKVIVGIESNRRVVNDAAVRLNAPVMVSANSLWDDKKSKFKYAWLLKYGFKIHLDSGGFVAMKRYGGFRFSVEQYATLAMNLSPEWWAQMDQCCEPEVAANRAEVFRRIDATAKNLHECRRAASEVGATPPMMVLQGWKPSDYVTGPAFDDPRFEWPNLVGVGSVCRRHLSGEDGLFAVIGRLDATLPPHVRLHLFGVKSTGAAMLKDHHRVESCDSMAWAASARQHSRKASNEIGERVPCTNQVRADFMESWTLKQRAAIKPSQQRYLFNND